MKPRKDFKKAALPEKGLVIRQPWAGMIVDGQKSWELRKKGTKIRGTFAVLNNKTVLGTAELVDSIGPLTLDDMMKNRHLSRESEEEIRKDAKDGYVYAWVLKDQKRLQKPRPYKHPSGAVTWVNLKS